MILGQRDRDVGEESVLRAIASDPDSEQNLQSDPGRKLGHLVQPVVDGIGADAFGYLGKLAQILRDLLRTDDERRVMRCLIVAERCVGNTLQFRRAIDRCARQRHRCGQPPPHRSNNTQRYQEKRQRRATAHLVLLRKLANGSAYLALRRGHVDPLIQPCAQLRRNTEAVILSCFKHGASKASLRLKLIPPRRVKRWHSKDFPAANLPGLQAGRRLECRCFPQTPAWPNQTGRTEYWIEG